MENNNIPQGHLNYLSPYIIYGIELTPNEQRVLTILLYEYRQARHKAKGRDWARCYFQSTQTISEKSKIPYKTMEKQKIMTSLQEKGYLYAFRNWDNANHLVPLDKGDSTYGEQVKTLEKLKTKLALIKSLRNKNKQEANAELDAEAQGMLFNADILKEVHKDEEHGTDSNDSNSGQESGQQCSSSYLGGHEEDSDTRGQDEDRSTEESGVCSGCSEQSGIPKDVGRELPVISEEVLFTIGKIIESASKQDVRGVRFIEDKAVMILPTSYKQYNGAKAFLEKNDVKVMTALDYRDMYGK